MGIFYLAVNTVNSTAVDHTSISQNSLRFSPEGVVAFIAAAPFSCTGSYLKASLPSRTPKITPAIVMFNK